MNVGGQEKFTDFYCVDLSKILLLQVSWRR